MVNGCDGEVKTYAHSPSRSLRNSPSASPSHSFSAGNSIPSQSQFNRATTQHSESNVASTADVNGLSKIAARQNGNQDDVKNMVVDRHSSTTTDDCQCPSGDDTTTATNGQQEIMDTSEDDYHKAETSTTVPVISNSIKGFCLILKVYMKPFI